MAHGSSHSHCIGEISTLAAVCLSNKIGWSARCITHDTRNISGHDLGQSLARTMQCYLLLQLTGTISFLNGIMVSCHVSASVDNYPVKTVDAYVSTHTVTHQLRQSIRAHIGSGGGARADIGTVACWLATRSSPVRLMWLRPVPCGQCSSARARAADVAPRGPAAPRPSP